MKKKNKKINDRLSPVSKAFVLIIGLITIISMLLMPAGNMKQGGNGGGISATLKK
jgi:hypothetical protein